MIIWSSLEGGYTLLNMHNAIICYLIAINWWLRDIRVYFEDYRCDKWSVWLVLDKDIWIIRFGIDGLGVGQNKIIDG